MIADACFTCSHNLHGWWNWPIVRQTDRMPSYRFFIGSSSFSYLEIAMISLWKPLYIGYPNSFPPNIWGSGDAQNGWYWCLKVLIPGALCFALSSLQRPKKLQTNAHAYYLPLTVLPQELPGYYIDIHYSFRDMFKSSFLHCTKIGELNEFHYNR